MNNLSRTENAFPLLGGGGNLKNIWKTMTSSVLRGLKMYLKDLKNMKYN
jgi:hypothetical protein